MAFETQLVVPHSVRQMTVEFRTSLAKSPVDASWGLSVFSVGALCSGETASVCNSGMPAPGNYAGPVDGKSAVLGLVSAVIDEKYSGIHRLVKFSRNIGMVQLLAWTAAGVRDWILGSLGQSCSTVCANAGLACSTENGRFPQQLSESVTVALFETNGKSCASRDSSANQNFPSFAHGRCYIGTGTLSCSSSYSQYERLCACSVLP